MIFSDEKAPPPREGHSDLFVSHTIGPRRTTQGVEHYRYKVIDVNMLLSIRSE